MKYRQNFAFSMIHSEKRQFSKTELQLFSKKKKCNSKSIYRDTNRSKTHRFKTEIENFSASVFIVILAFVGFSVPLGSHKYLKTLYICTNLKKKKKKETQSQNQQQKPAKQIKKTRPSTDRANIEYYLFQIGSF